MSSEIKAQGRTGLYRRRDNVEFREVGEEMFLIDPETSAIHHLNVTGAAVWRLLAEPIAIGDMVDIFHEAFPSRSPRILKKTLRRILAELEDGGLIDVV